MHYKHYTLLLFAAITYFTAAIAQPRIKDQGTIGGEDNDYFTSMSFTKDGGLIVGGASFSNITAQKTQKSKGGNDYWVVKLDSNKTIQWDKTIGSRHGDHLSAVQQTTDGDYILGGFSYGDISGDKTSGSKGWLDYWIVKLDEAGNIQWDKTIGGSGNDSLNALQQTSDGGYILGGSSSSNKSGDKTTNSKGFKDFWIVKLDAAGNIQWDKTIGGNQDDVLNALQQTSDGGYILGGPSYSRISGNKTEDRRGSGYNSDYWIVKVDASGNIQWDKTIGGKSTDDLYALQQTTDGGYILGGYSSSYKGFDKTQDTRGGTDYWIVKLDSGHNIQWDKTIGGNDQDQLYALRQTKDGGYILSGYSFSNISSEKTENSRGVSDYWVVKVNSTGKKQWDKTIGGSIFDQAYAVHEIKKNHYAIGGYSNSRISGDKTGDNRGPGYYYDYWLVELKYVKPDSVAIAQVQTSKLAAPQPNTNTTFYVYPNPATSVLHIHNRGKSTFTLSEQGGKTILSKIINGNVELSVVNIRAGTYYLTNTTTRVTQKVIITR